MITRIWHGRTRAEVATEYLHYIEATGIPHYRSTRGNLGAQILRRVDGDICHFWTVTQWQDLDSVRQFAGPEYEKARYYPEDGRYLLEFEEKVIHCETFVY